jgi:hypothetical protein
MATLKKKLKEILEEEVVVDKEVKVDGKGENHPDFDPNLPESKQRWLR